MITTTTATSATTATTAIATATTTRATSTTTATTTTTVEKTGDAHHDIRRPANIFPCTQADKMNVVEQCIFWLTPPPPTLKAVNVLL